MNTTKIVCIICSCLFSQLKAQESTASATAQNRLNALKTNLLSPLSISYERGLGKHFSLSVGGVYFPSFSVGEPTDELGFVSLADPSSGFSVEARLYTSKTKAPMNGFYVGAYYLFRIADVWIYKISTTARSTTNIKAYIPSDLTTYGLMIGKQKIRTKGFTTDFQFGVGYYAIGNVPSLVSNNDESLKFLDQLSKLKSGLSPRLSFSLGYAF